MQTYPFLRAIADEREDLGRVLIGLIPRPSQLLFLSIPFLILYLHKSHNFTSFTPQNFA